MTLDNDDRGFTVFPSLDNNKKQKKANIFNM